MMVSHDQFQVVVLLGLLGGEEHGSANYRLEL
jgi:hypothetical protein